MNKLFSIVCGLASASSIFAQSSLPVCNKANAVATWTNCFGTVTWNKDVQYVGEFRNGRPHGYGRHTEYGFEYEGEFVGGVREGVGKFTWGGAGSTYVGEWLGGKRHGRGIYTSGDRSSPPLEGIWSDSQFIRAERIPDHIAGRAPPPNRTTELPGKKSSVLIESAKEKCGALGFKHGTEKFGDCVLRLSE